MSLEELNNKIKELEKENNSLKKENKLFKKEINNLEKEIKELKNEDKQKYYKNFEYYELATYNMLEYFIKYYMFEYLNIYMRKKYNDDFTDYIKSNKKIRNELNELSYKKGILNIIDEDVFYNNEYIKIYYRIFESYGCGDFAKGYLPKAFNELNILENFKELNIFLDEEFNKYINEEYNKYE